MTEKQKKEPFNLLRELGRIFKPVNPFRKDSQKPKVEDAKSNYIIGRRRLDKLKKDLIQLRPTEDICSLLVGYLKDFLQTRHIGIFLWDEATGSFASDPTGQYVDVKFRVYDPFLMYAAEVDRIIEKKELKYESTRLLDPEIQKSQEDFFSITASDLVIPLCLNQSLVALIFVGVKKDRYPGKSRLYNIEEVRSVAVMALSNSMLYARLEGLLQSLEEKVKERTRALEEAQAQLVEREKLATLGVMVAGIAHELNTPAGVIQGSTENLEKNLETILGLLMNAPDRILKQEKLLKSILKRLSERKFSVISGAYKLKKELAEKLPANIRNPQRFAGLLIEKGIVPKGVDPLTDNLVQDLIELLPSLDEESENSLLSFIEQMSSLEKNLSNLSHAITSIVRIVRALKTYSRPDQGMIGLYSIEDGLDNTIILLASLWKHKIEIVRDYNNVGEAQCDGDEINQVWTNLITNACQAMAETGNAKLIIRTERLEDDIRVQIRDNGPGIPQAIISKVWDPFFTTKDQGQGSGLGLAIVRNILERHGGSIQIESKPGNTVFTILLPIRYTASTVKERKKELPFKFR